MIHLWEWGKGGWPGGKKLPFVEVEGQLFFAMNSKTVVP